MLLPIITIAQYSNYYQVNSNVNVNANINKNVNVNGTVTTIDYGALANANAQRESNRLTQQRIAIEQAQYRDAKERNDAIMNANRAIEIAEDPMKAHTYGFQYTSKLHHQDKGMGWLKNLGFLSYEEVMSIPHKSLLENVGQGRWENISIDGITTEIITYPSSYNYRNLPYLDDEQIKKYSARYLVLNEYYLNHQKPKKRNYKKDRDAYNEDLNRYNEVCDSLDNYGYLKTSKNIAKYVEYEEKSMFLSVDGDSVFVHKKDVAKRTVYGKRGYRSTVIWEDDYEIGITDNYLSDHYDNISSSAKVRYKADKSSGLTFEDLEGRRFYLSKLIDKLIATRRITNAVYASEDKYKPKRRSYSNSEDYLQSYDKWEKIR